MSIRMGMDMVTPALAPGASVVTTREASRVIMAPSLLGYCNYCKENSYGTNLGDISSYPEGDKMRKLLLLIPIVLVLLACNISMSINPSLSTTPPAQPNFPSTVEPSPSAPLTGTIMGKLSYPSEFIPPLRVVAFSLTDGKAYFVETAKNQPEYSLEVPAGNYYVVSYPHEGTAGNTGQVDSYALGGGSFAGGYTQMVPCGLAVGCDDHTLLTVTVTAGQTVAADPGDWYAPEGTFPPMPNP